jgi:hypothetical protein
MKKAKATLVSFFVAFKCPNATEKDDCIRSTSISQEALKEKLYNKEVEFHYAEDDSIYRITTNISCPCGETHEVEINW